MTSYPIGEPSGAPLTVVISLAPAPKTISWTVWPPARDDQKHVAWGGTTESGTWADLCRWVEREHAGPIYAKGRGPQWSPVVSKDGHRCIASTLAVTAIVMDCDEAGDWAMILGHLDAIGAAYLAYRSSGHTDDTPKWRLVLPMQQVLWANGDPEGMNEAWKVMYHRLRIELGALAGFSEPDRGGFDIATCDVARIFYLGHRRSADTPVREVRWADGQAVDGSAYVGKSAPRGAGVKLKGLSASKATAKGATYTKKTLPPGTMIELTADGKVTGTVSPRSVPGHSHCRCPEHGGSGRGSSWVEGGTVFCSVCQTAWQVEQTFNYGFQNFALVALEGSGGTTPLKIMPGEAVPPENTGEHDPDQDEFDDSVEDGEHDEHHPEDHQPPEFVNEVPDGGVSTAGGTTPLKIMCHQVVPPEVTGHSRVADDRDVPQAPSSQGTVTLLSVNSKRLTDAVPDAIGLVPPEGGIIVIRSPQETGKTYLATQVAQALLRRLPDDAQVAPTHRVALVRDLARRLGYETYDVNPTAQRVATTLDSLWRVPTFAPDNQNQIQDRDFSLVVLDEVSQVLRHLVGGTIGADAPRIIRHLKVIMGAAKYILAMDADASTETIEILRLLDSKHRPIVVIDNGWRPSDRSALIYDDRDDHLGAFVADVAAGHRLAYFTCGGPARAAAVADMARSARAGVEVRVYSQDTSKLPDVYDELADINAATPKYAVLIATPTLGSGVDIQDLQIDRVYLDVPSHDVGADEAVQLGFRVRHPKDRQWRVWVDRRKQKRSTNTAQIQAELLDVRKQTQGAIAKKYKNAPAMHLVSSIEMAPLDPLHLDLYCRAWAHVHEQTNDIDAALRARLKEAGFTISDQALIDPVAVQATRDGLKAAREADAKTRANRITGARDISVEEAERIQKARKAPQGDLDAAEKSVIQDFYGQVSDVDLILEDRRGTLRPGIINLALHLVVRDQRHQEALIRDVRRVRQGLTARVKGQYIAAILLPRVLAWYGIPDGTKIETYTAPLSVPSLTPADKDTRALLALVKRYMGVSYRPKTKTVGGVTVRIAPVDAMHLLSRLLGRFGLGLGHDDAKVNGVKVRTYRIKTKLALHRIGLAQAAVKRLRDALQALEQEAKMASNGNMTDDEDIDAVLAVLGARTLPAGTVPGGTTPPKNKTEEVVPPASRALDDDAGEPDDDHDEDPNWGSLGTDGGDWVDGDDEGSPSTDAKPALRLIVGGGER